MEKGKGGGEEEEEEEEEGEQSSMIVMYSLERKKQYRIARPFPCTVTCPLTRRPRREIFFLPKWYSGSP